MDRGFWGGIAPGPVDGWMIYCFLLTCWVPGFILRNVFGESSSFPFFPSEPLQSRLFSSDLSPPSRCLGKRNPEAQRAWREKMGLVGVIALVMLFVGYVRLVLFPSSPSPFPRYLLRTHDLAFFSAHFRIHHHRLRHSAQPIPLRLSPDRLAHHQRTRLRPRGLEPSRHRRL
jgi:hypothetical protein